MLPDGASWTAITRNRQELGRARALCHADIPEAEVPRLCREAFAAGQHARAAQPWKQVGRHVRHQGAQGIAAAHGDREFRL